MAADGDSKSPSGNAEFLNQKDGRVNQRRFAHHTMSRVVRSQGCTRGRSTQTLRLIKTCTPVDRSRWKCQQQRKQQRRRRPGRKSPRSRRRKRPLQVRSQRPSDRPRKRQRPSRLRRNRQQRANQLRRASSALLLCVDWRRRVDMTRKAGTGHDRRLPAYFMGECR